LWIDQETEKRLGPTRALEALKIYKDKKLKSEVYSYIQLKSILDIFFVVSVSPAALNTARKPSCS
jgi:hypothetical protein